MLIMQEEKKNMRLKDRLLSGVFDMVKPVEDRAAQEYPKLLAFEKEMRRYMGYGHAVIFDDILGIWDPENIPMVDRIKPAEPAYDIADIINWSNISMYSSVHSYSLDEQLKSMRGITYLCGAGVAFGATYSILSGVYTLMRGMGLSSVVNIVPDHLLEESCWTRVGEQLDQNGMPSTQSAAERLVQEGKILVKGAGDVVFPEDQMEARQSIGTSASMICAPNDVRDALLSDVSSNTMMGSVTALLGVGMAFYGLKSFFGHCASIKKVSVLKDVFDHNAKVSGDVLCRSGVVEIRISRFDPNNVPDRPPGP